MDWQDCGSGFWIARCGASQPAEEAFQALWDRVVNHVSPENGDTSLDVIRVETWVDSGRFIAYPARRNSVERREKNGCQLIFEGLKHAYEELEQQDLSDNEFTLHVFDLRQQWVNTFFAVLARQSPRGNTVQVCGEGGDDVLAEVKV